jgi:hypothetical protein
METAQRSDRELDTISMEVCAPIVASCAPILSAGTYGQSANYTRVSFRSVFQANKLDKREMKKKKKKEKLPY